MIRKRYTAQAAAVRTALEARDFESPQDFVLHAERGLLDVRFWPRRGSSSNKKYILNCCALFAEIEAVGVDVFADWIAERVRRTHIRPCPIPCAGDGVFAEDGYSFTVTLGAERVENRLSWEAERKRHAEQHEAFPPHAR